MLIEWTMLHPYKRTKQKSFEQLCYQLAAKLFESKGILTSVDDSGGGDGVEFFLTLEDGTEWGWQAKYYEGAARLNEGNRKQQIIKSLKRAVDVHPALTQWFLCLPIDLTPNEHSWFRDILPTHVPPHRKVHLQVWDETTLHELINRPQFNGIKQAFFNQLDLSPTWFAHAFDNQFQIVKNKFDDLLYVPNEEFEYWYVNPVLCNLKFQKDRIAYYPQKLQELTLEAKEKLTQLQNVSGDWKDLAIVYQQRYSEFNRLLTALIPLIQERYQNLTPNGLQLIAKDSLQAETSRLEKIQKEIIDFRYEWYTKTAEHRETKKVEPESDGSKFYNLESHYKNVLEELRYYHSHSSIPLERRVAHYLGNGGDGKTNFCVGLVKEYLANQHPAVFIPAIKFTGQHPLPEQILSLLDIKIGYRFADFLDALNTLGKVYNVRVPIILDGLNEAVNVNGFLNERLKQDLPVLEKEILCREYLVFLTTSRKSYKYLLWPQSKGKEDERFHRLNGFTNHEDKRKLIRTYFTHYKIQGDLSFLSLDRFTKPLYLKIFCESVNPGKDELKQVTLGFDSIYTIFEAFVQLCNDHIFQRISKLGRPPLAVYKQVASRVLRKLAQQLWEHPSRAVTLETLMEMADGGIPADFNKSITKSLLDEELLFIRSVYQEEETVYLTYDLMTGYFIAKYLLEEMDEPAHFFNSPKELQPLISDDDTQLHPNYEDILDSLCSLLPIKNGVFVHDLLSKPLRRDLILRTLFKKSVTATILLSPEFIPKKQIGLMKKLAKDLRNVDRLLHISKEVFFVVNHPFNFFFWSRILHGLQMNERDRYWSEYVRNLEDGFFENLLEEFDQFLSLPFLSEEQDGKIELVTEFFLWALTTTSGSLKEKIAKALYRFGCHFPGAFFPKYYAAASMDDPTVFEWYNLILYNVVLFATKVGSHSDEEQFLQLADFLQMDVLQNGGQYATNHLITRNYAYATYKLLVRKMRVGQHFPKPEELKKNFRRFGVTQWQVAPDKNEGEYADGNALIDYFFRKEKMPYVMVDKGSEYNPTPAFLRAMGQLRWRAYQLGYRFDLFGEIDKSIARARHWGETYQKTQRYADKYIEIAFYEFCGYLSALGKLKSYEDIGYLRTFEPKVDLLNLAKKSEQKNVEQRLVMESFINPNVTLQQWGSDESVPDLDAYLIRNDFTGEGQDFVLLSGLVRQHDRAVERQVFIQVTTVFIRNKSLAAAQIAFNGVNQLGFASNNSIPTSSHLHDSEIPDADVIPPNKFITWYYASGAKMVTQEYNKLNLRKDGHLLPEAEADEVWKKVIEKLQYLHTPRSNRRDIPVKFVSLTSQTRVTSIEKAFHDLGITLEEEVISKEEAQEITRPLKVFFPVRQLKGQNYICKNIIDYFDLEASAGETDLHDLNGNLASFVTSFEVEYVDQENFTYLRKDLLDTYLKDHNLTMFTIIWGERDYYPPDGDWTRRTKKLEQRKWAKFYDAKQYLPYAK